MSFPFLDALRWRYATQVFDPARKLAPEQLALLEEAVRLTPSGFNLMPYRLYRVEDVAVREKILAACWNQRQVVDASHLYVLAAMKSIREAYVREHVSRLAAGRGQTMEELDRHQNQLLKFAGNPEAVIAAWAAKQAFIALGSLVNAAALLEIDACPMEGFRASAVDEALGLIEHHDNLTTVALCPVGYRAADDKYAGIAKVRPPSELMVSVV